MNNNNLNHTVYTGLFGKVNKEILNSIIGQLSDGKWENSPAMNKYWENAEIDKAVDGELVILVDTECYRSGFRGMTSAEVMNKFAGWLKAIVQDELLGPCAEWNRLCTLELDYLGSALCPVTVADAYKAYDALKGRNTAKKIYGKGKTEAQILADNIALKQKAVAEAAQNLENAKRLLAYAAKELAELQS